MRCTVVVYKNPEGSYTATVPQLPGCVAQGETLEEALALIKGGIELHLEGLLAEGLEVPEETQPIITSVEVQMPVKVRQ